MARRGVEDLERDLFIVDKAGANGARRPSYTAQVQSEPQQSQTTGKLGQRLRDARMARGFSQEDVARALKFTTSQINALEQSALRDMAPVYANGFVRCYAEHLGEKTLGLSAGEAVKVFKTEAGAGYNAQAMPMARARPTFRVPRLPGFSVVMVAGLLSIAVYAGWHFFKDPTATASPVTDYHGAVADISVYRVNP
ncbi:MAG: helix-turn-helix domain-containing protein [Alphaproteobacteria bacterium]